MILAPELLKPFGDAIESAKIQSHGDNLRAALKQVDYTPRESRGRQLGRWKRENAAELRPSFSANGLLETRPDSGDNQDGFVL